MKKIKVGVVEDESMAAQMLTTWLDRTGVFKAVGYAGTDEQGWRLCTTRCPDVVLLDVGLASGDGLRLAQRLKTRAPQIKPIIVSGREDPYLLYRVHQLALPGYVSKSSALATLQEAILTVAEGRTYYTEPFGRHLQSQDAFFRILSKREVEVLFATTQAHPNGTACKKLQVTKGTLLKHLANIRRKLGLHTTAELVRYAMHLGMDL